MTIEPSNNQEAELDELVARYEQLVEDDRPVEAESLVASFPRFSTQLREHIRIRRLVDHACAPIREAVSAVHAPPQIEGYENFTELGRGGMGVVYEAIQTSTQRRVAVKVIRPERLAALPDHDRRDLIERFRIEPIATMDHQNIVRVYHAGCDRGNPYLVMELVTGVTLRDHIRGNCCRIADVVALLEQAARGIHHAHRHGVLHRDLKPANVIVDQDLRIAKVADFGLAKVDQKKAVDSPDSDRPTSDGMGTLPYMSPEQLDDGEQATVASDVYGLSATLYESLCGRPPFVGSSQQLRHAIRFERPPAPRDLNPAIPRRLEKICQRGLSKDPNERFESAEQFADALKRLRVVPGGNDAVYFARMGWSLLLFGLVCLIVHSAIYILHRRGAGELVIWSTMLSLYLPLFAMFWRTAIPDVDSPERAARQLWYLWLGHLLVVSLTIISVRSIAGDLSSALAAVYPILSACTAAALLAMASTFWRFHAVLSGCWMGVAVLNVVTPQWAALEYGLAGLATSAVIGGYELRLLGEQLPDGPVPVGSRASGVEPPSLICRPVSSSRLSQESD